MLRSWLREFAAAALCIAAAVPVFGANTVRISFEGPAGNPPIPIGVRFSAQGVLLPKIAQVYEVPSTTLHVTTNSPTHVLASRAVPAEFDTGPLVIDFTAAASNVVLYTGIPSYTGTDTVRLTLEAFDANMQLVDRVVRSLTGPSDITTALQVKAPQPSQYIIKAIRLTARNDAGFEYYKFIDDLSVTFEGAPPVLATEPPNVYIGSPQASIITDGHITIAGQIFGGGVLPEYAPPEIVVAFAADPGWKLLPEHRIELTQGNGLTWVAKTGSAPEHWEFSVPFDLSHFGTNTITVNAANAKGVGSKSVTVTYLPAAISAAYQAKGGAGAFGDFAWGTSTPGCDIAAFRLGAIFTSGAKAYTVMGPIFDKWSAAITTPGMSLGCVTGDERQVPDGVGGVLGIAQDFEQGRIYFGPYSKVPAERGAYIAKMPFIDALDRFEAAKIYLGLPVTDPVDQYQPMLPRLWQRFERHLVDGPVTYTAVSTMEISDNPLTLWVATPDLVRAERAGVYGTAWSGSVDKLARIPTAWYSYACTAADKPCTNVGVPTDAPKMPYQALVDACQDSHYPWSNVPQWASLKSTKEIVPVVGTLTASVKSGLAGDDAIMNHSCSVPQDPFGGVDWCWKLLPDAAYLGLLGVNSGMLEIEYEWCLVGFPTPLDPSDPSKGATEDVLPGDKLTIAGRWISDCGCHPWYSCSGSYQSEIHPPAVLFNAYSKKSGPFPATIGDLVYFDWWYKGQTLDIEIFPPPRYKPDAHMEYGIPTWPAMCPTDSGYCGIKVTEVPAGAPNHIRITLSGRPDVTFNIDPKEAGNGQLFHGYALPTGSGPGRPVPPTGFEHMVPIRGAFPVFWSSVTTVIGP